MEHSEFVEHGYCLLWDPALVWLHVISDVVTGIAYYSIPIALFYFIYKRRDLPFQSAFVLFGAFILACGTTHFLAAYTIYVPAYWAEGVVKAITAVVSVIAVIVLIPMIPKAIALPSLTNALGEIKALNSRLEKHVDELTISEEKYRLLHQSMMDGFAMVDMEGKISEFNESFRAMLGYSPDDLKDLTYEDITPVKWHAMEMKILEEQVLTRGYSDVYEKEYNKKDGSALPVELRTFLLKDSIGKPRGMWAIVRDISARKKSEEALRQSEERFRLLYERAPIPYQSLDGSGYFIAVNDTWLQKMGYSKNEVLGKHFSDFMTPESKELQKKRLPCFVDSGEIHDAEFEMIRKDGSHVIASFDGKIGYDDKGNFKQTHCIFQDVTERKKTEAEKLKLEEQLRQAQKMEAIGQLAGGIAHDFNNVLSAIMGYGYLLKKKIGHDSPMEDDINQILESADRAAEVTRNLLAFSRKQIMDTKPVDIVDIVRKVDKMLSRIIGEDIELKTEFGAEKIVCIADAGQIEQVLINLAANARDAMPKGGVLVIKAEIEHLDELFVRSYGYGAPGTFAMITVSDTGVGIAQEEIDKIFEPFFTTKEVGKGTGLGLAMVYGIIKQHDGHITVYSEAGHGTTFKIYLPIEESAVVYMAPKPEDQSPLRGNETILVAEDDYKLRKLSEVVLTGNGYNVITASDGEEAIKKFIEKKDRIQLVMVDMIMPRKSGKEVFDAIMSIKPDTKILFSSGYSADRLDNIDLLKDNLNFISKPVLPGALLKKVRELLDA